MYVCIYVCAMSKSDRPESLHHPVLVISACPLIMYRNHRRVQECETKRVAVSLFPLVRCMNGIAVPFGRERVRSCGVCCNVRLKQDTAVHELPALSVCIIYCSSSSTTLIMTAVWGAPSLSLLIRKEVQRQTETKKEKRRKDSSLLRHVYCNSYSSRL